MNIDRRALVDCNDTRGGRQVPQRDLFSQLAQFTMNVDVQAVFAGIHTDRYLNLRQKLHVG